MSAHGAICIKRVYVNICPATAAARRTCVNKVRWSVSESGGYVQVNNVFTTRVARRSPKYNKLDGSESASCSAGATNWEIQMFA